MEEKVVPVPEEYLTRVGHIMHEHERLTVVAARHRETGEKVYLLVATREDPDGRFCIAPLARLDVDLSAYEPEFEEEEG
jgi:hypothetical protein